MSLPLKKFTKIQVQNSNLNQVINCTTSCINVAVRGGGGGGHGCFTNRSLGTPCIARLTLYHSILTFNKFGKRDLFKKKNIVGKGENAGNQHFLLFPQCFLPPLRASFNFSAIFVLSSANAFNLNQSKNSSFGKELMGQRDNMKPPVARV